MKFISPIVLLVLVLSSCTQSGTQTNTQAIDSLKSDDSLVYQYQSVFAGTALNKSKSDSSYAMLEYPVFEADSFGLNDFVNAKMTHSDGGTEKFETAQALANTFVKEYEKSAKKFPQYAHTWHYRSRLSVVNNYKNLISFQHEGASYTGGAHGSYYLLYYNYNTDSQKEIKLTELIDPLKYDEFEKIAERIFRKAEGISTDFNLSDAYFFESGKFYLNENFLILPDRLRFVYNIYEIKPYSEGITRIDIPYSEISGLLLKNNLPLIIQ